jgi:Ca-activated chloride channel family protein
MDRLIYLVGMFVLFSGQLFGQLRISPEKINFGDFTKESEAVIDIIVENTGTKTDFLLRSTFGPYFDVRFSDKRIEPGKQIVVRVKFNPREKGDFKENAELYFASMQTPVIVPITADVSYVNVNGNTPCPDFNQKLADCCASNFFLIEVYDAETKLPIDKAKVKIEEDGYIHLNILTNGDGKVSQSARIGYYSIIVEKSGYQKEFKTSYINNANSRFIFYLKKDPNYKPNLIIPDLPKTDSVVVVRDTSMFSIDQFVPNNVVFLLDISGSMGNGNKLDLMKFSLESLVGILRPVDQVAMISYANEAKVLLPMTTGDQKELMKQLVADIRTGGKTAGAKGFKKAFQLLKIGYIEGGNNQLIVITDGAFAVEDQAIIEKMVAKYGAKGIKTTVVAIQPSTFAKDKLFLVSQAGNGSFLPIHDQEEAERILIEELKKQSAK